MSKCNRYDETCFCSECEADRLVWADMKRQAGNEINELLCLVRSPSALQDTLLGDRRDTGVMAAILQDKSDPSCAWGGSHDRRAFVGL